MLADSDVPELEALARFSARVEVARLLGRHRLPGEGRRPQLPRTPRKGEAPARLRPGRYRSSDGLEIWVGRSAQGNDHLTTRLARGNDLFLHVEASPGSHVVVRLAGRKDAPQESLLEAAELAVHFSKQRDAERATLHVAPIKDVRKPSRAKPGLVQVLRGRSFVLRRDAARLARVLASRVEDAD
jgi:predicted ribosome quality control (RQC) complex YloA/Tae2 family protein